MTTMLLAIDSGNSTVAFGLYPNPAKGEPLHVAKLPTEPPPSAAQCRRVLSLLLRLAAAGNQPGTRQSRAKPGLDVVISSVVPRLNRTLIALARTISSRPPLVVSHRAPHGLILEVPKPSRIGSDRIANAAAASSSFRRPVAVVDCGTATTITFVGPHGRFHGGAIMPGLALMSDALHRAAARLPRAPLTTPRNVLGRETAASIASGIICGTAGAVQHLVSAIEKELGFRVQLVLTGGQGALVSPFIRRRHRVMPALTFEGLRLIYLRNTHPVT